MTATMTQENAKKPPCFTVSFFKRETVKQNAISCNTERNKHETISLKALAHKHFSETKLETNMKQSSKNSETKPHKNRPFVSCKNQDKNEDKNNQDFRHKQLAQTPIYELIGDYKSEAHLIEDLKKYPNNVPCPRNAWAWQLKDRCLKRCDYIPKNCVYWNVAPYTPVEHSEFYL